MNLYLHLSGMHVNDPVRTADFQPKVSVRSIQLFFFDDRSKSYLVSQGQPKLTKVKRLFFQDGSEVKTIDDVEHDAELWMRFVFKLVPFHLVSYYMGSVEPSELGRKIFEILKMI